MPSTNVAIAPSSQLKRAANRVMFAIATLMSSRTTRAVDQGRWEAPKHAWALSNLILRHAEATAELARLDAALLPSALATSRASLEGAIRMSWLLEPDNEWQREARYVTMVREGVKYHSALGSSSVGGASEHATLASIISGHVDKVAAQLPEATVVPKAVPKIRVIAEALRDGVYENYRTASQYTHGTDAALWLYRQDMGTEARFGEFITQRMWALPLHTVWDASTLAYTLLIGVSEMAPTLDLEPYHEQVMLALNDLAQAGE